ncbi:carboxypeptidase regulatory-like domain-containing protein [Chitinophaga sp. MM2321]|uniref:carboxypeptidase regulatory-like domain-containing protein n=1 Tax=Chitinophaga sp. MM2321 TaxID=3137178 RepID=UPI0032D58FDE
MKRKYIGTSFFRIVGNKFKGSLKLLPVIASVALATSAAYAAPKSTDHTKSAKGIVVHAATGENPVVANAIAGTVTTGDLKPIEGVTIKIYKATDTKRTTPVQSLKTDSKGLYNIDASKLSGDYIVQASKQKFLTKELEIKIGEGVTTYPDLWLEPAKKPTAVISIDASVKKPVRMSFGFNEYVIAATPYHRFNEAPYVETMKESGANIMRFPGGTIANWYDWKNDDFMTEDIKKIVPEDMVKREAHKTEEDYQETLKKFRDNYLDEYISKGTRSKEVRGKYGYEDFRDMSAQIGADIYYVGNVSFAPGGKNPADHLVDWMQHLKGRGLTVKYLELGNELIGPHGSKNTQAIPNQMYDLDRYMATCQDISKRVKKIFPQVKIGILADGLGNKLGGSEIDLICRKINDNYPRDFYDAIIIHSYLRTTDRNAEGPQFRKDKIFALSKKIVEFSVNHWKTVFPGKEIWMTETGYIAGTPDDEKNFTTNMFTAMLEADYFLRWTDHDDAVTSYIKFYSISTTPYIKSSRFWKDNSIVNTPVGYAYSLVAGAVKNASDRLTTTVKNNGSYTMKTAAWIQNKDGQGKLIPGKGEAKVIDVDVDYITASSFLSKDGNTLYVPFVNKSQAARDIKLAIAGVTLKGATAELQHISGPLFGRNTVKEPAHIVPVTTKVAVNGNIKVPAYAVGVIKISIKK